MKKYIITETAGRMVAGTSNTGAGTSIYLTDKQAEYELTLGTLILAPDEDAADNSNAGGDETVTGGDETAQETPKKSPAKGAKA